MRLSVSNFTRIAEADIEIDGLTVIAGQNNTGKSTIGKILFSVFNSINNLDDKITSQMENDLFEYIYDSLQNVMKYIYVNQNLSQGLISQRRRRIARHLSAILTSGIEDIKNEEDIKNIIKKYLFENNFKAIVEVDEFVDEISEFVSSRFFSSRELVVNEVISRYFANIFGEQLNSLKRDRNDAKIQINIKEKNNTFIFCDNECVDKTIEYNILNEAFYIDNPFILDEFRDSLYDKSELKNHIAHKVMAPNDIMNGIFDVVNSKEKLKQVYVILNQIIHGDIVSVSSEFALNMDEYSEPIKLQNLSTGLKSFVIIKMLLEKGCLKEKDVLILDEPEIHLHPEWQILYAEIIVLLQKTFDLSVIVTTHSVDFLEALEFFSKKHSIESKCRYYLSSSEDGMSIFEDVTENIDKIYSQMIKPGVILDKLKYEMENMNNE